MFLHELKPAKGARKLRKRLGRGSGSGHGTTAGKGTKGQKARTGSKVYPLYEGGQVPLTRRLPKRGFRNGKFKKEYKIINLIEIEKKFDDGETVTYETLKEKGLVKGEKKNIKMLGRGNLSKKLIFNVDLISSGAKSKIESSQSKIES
jgi:large subunit ribosomal protein L15